MPNNQKRADWLKGLVKGSAVILRTNKRPDEQAVVRLVEGSSLGIYGQNSGKIYCLDRGTGQHYSHPSTASIHPLDTEEDAPEAREILKVSIWNQLGGERWNELTCTELSIINDVLNGKQIGAAT